MGKVQKVSIALTEELAEAVRAAVASGAFGSSSEVVHAALREWGERRERTQAEIELIRNLWKEGIDSGRATSRPSTTSSPRHADVTRQEMADGSPVAARGVRPRTSSTSGAT